ncbi:MAG: hypothetical protein LBK77_02030 [Spirochaetaceae bacterium]|jgi:hypothetical protein|nr:hypothetical protein [Spirochaetaceae bacterium]
MKNIRLPGFGLCIVLAFFSPSLSAQGRMVFPSLDAVPASHQYARRLALNGSAYWQDLAEAALWASSVNAGPGAEEKAAAYMERINSAVAELSAATDLPADPKERGEYVLVFLHRRFLKSYSEYQTRVDEIFISGRYNCVSSAVLYMVLGLSAGLDIKGIMTKDHAFITVNTGAESIDVETTNLYGFDPGNRKEFHDAFGKATGFAYVPARNYRDRVEINGIELVSLILSNRIAVLEKGNRYAEAVPLAINRAALLSAGESSGSQNKADFFEDSRGDTMNRIFNLGAYLIKTGREDDALAWAEYSGGLFPDPRWQDFINTAVNNKLVKLIRTKKTAQARAELSALKPRLGADHYNALDTMVLEAEAADMVNGIRNPGDAEAALAFLSRSWEKLPAQVREEMRTAAVLKEAERIGRSRDWTGGMTWLNAAMEQYGKNSRFESALRTFRQNRVGQLHNEFAALFNKGNYAGAKASIEKALAEFSEERQLLQDLNLVNKALQQ